jgi:4-amino-4-deoxy-L-arabinose transferase-like glycosyltransferase
MDVKRSLFSDQLAWAWILPIAAIFLFIPFIGGVHLFDWDEINFAEISREMIRTGDYLTVQVNYQPFFEKPPLFMWMQVACMKIFGVNEFAARLPNALAGVIVAVLLFRLGRYWMDRRFGILWSLSYMGSILPALYHKSGIIDPWFNLFIFCSLASWYEGSRQTSSASKWYWLSGLMSGLAIMTKGPVGPLLIGMSVLAIRIFSRNNRYLHFPSVLIFILGNILVSGIWFGLNWLNNGPDFIVAFIKYQFELLTHPVAGHKGFPGYHFIVTLFGVFPASIFAIGAFRKKQKDESAPEFELRTLMILLTAIVLVVFSLVQSKIVHYSSMTYFPLSFLSAWFLSRVMDNKVRWSAWHGSVFIVITTLIFIAMWALPWIGLHIQDLKSYLSLDAFTRSALDAPVSWSITDYVPFAVLSCIFVAAIVYWRKSDIESSIVTILLGVPLFVNIALIFFIGKIETYTQRAAVEFCQSKASQPVEITTIGYKSYLPYFYANKPVPVKNHPSSKSEMFHILRADKIKKLEEHIDWKVVGEKNGYIFLEE